LEGRGLMSDVRLLQGGVRGMCFVRGTNSQLAPLSPAVVGKWITPLMQ
jgi:hypothetical protein